ncbi:MAG: PIN domain-containing protein [Cocleimonas sp.]
MSVKVFVDTNILVYARDASEEDKQIKAKEWIAHLWKTRSGRLSYQSFNEYYVVTTQRLKPGLSKEKARSDLNALEAWNPITVDKKVIDNAWKIQDRYQFSWWDSLILSAAQVQGCEVLLSEDLQDGQVVGGVRVVNPFFCEVGSVNDF